MTKIGTEVAHATRDSDTTLKVKRSKANLHGQLDNTAADGHRKSGSDRMSTTGSTVSVRYNKLLLIRIVRSKRCVAVTAAAAAAAADALIRLKLIFERPSCVLFVYHSVHPLTRHNELRTDSDAVSSAGTNNFRDTS